MWYQVLIPAPILMIPILVMTTKGIHHNPKNESNSQSDVIVTYSNHAEAGNNEILVVPENTDISVTISPTEYPTVTTEKPIKQISEAEEPLQDEVVFIPNEKEVVRNGDYLQHDGLNIQDLMDGHKTVDEVLTAKDVRVETEPPNTDIVFISGKNNENTDKSETEKPKRKWEEDNFVYTSTRPPKLDCRNLICNNTIKSVCGERIENYMLKQRLFLNDCYFRKVNCNFKIATNRYRRVNLDKCKNFGVHNQTAFSFKPKPAQDILYKPVQVDNTRRTSSRRSMTMGIDGQFCSHACPVHCPAHYEPECAVSNTGRHRVFINHCALDRNSCSFGVVWRSVPLAECVGGKKADLKQNAAFIGWMQRVGILDKRGRLVLDP